MKRLVVERMWASAHVARHSGALSEPGRVSAGARTGRPHELRTGERTSGTIHGDPSGCIGIREVRLGRLTHLCELRAQDHLMRGRAGAIRGDKAAARRWHA